MSTFLCAATVGGILANDSAPVPFLYDNLAIAANVIHAAAANQFECDFISAMPTNLVADKSRRRDLGHY